MQAFVAGIPVIGAFSPVREREKRSRRFLCQCGLPHCSILHNFKIRIPVVMCLACKRSPCSNFAVSSEKCSGGSRCCENTWIQDLTHSSAVFGVHLQPVTPNAFSGVQCLCKPHVCFTWPRTVLKKARRFRCQKCRGGGVGLYSSYDCIALPLLHTLLFPFPGIGDGS